MIGIMAAILRMCYLLDEGKEGGQTGQSHLAYTTIPCHSERSGAK